MDPAPKVTVYVASHDYGRFLEATIESVLRQTMGSWELLLIDDGSTDNTPEVMTLYRGDPRIRIFRTEGIGLPAVCNLALRNARGEYIIRLDGDDIFDENILLVLSNMLDRSPDLAFVYPDYYLIDENGDIFAQERRRRILEENHILDAPANGACTLIRKRVIEELGGYREDLGAQDGFDLWTRTVNRYKIANVNLPLFYYRRHGRNLTDDTQRILSARRRIKRDAVMHELERFRPCVAVIPCRSQYDFTPDLWNEVVNGKTLLERDIEVCLSSDMFDRVVVGCDNPAAEDVVTGFADPRLSFVLRDSAETIRSRSIVSTLEKMVSPHDPKYQGIVAVCYTQTPFVSAQTFEEAVFTLVMNEADSAFGVEEIRSHLYRRSSHGLQPVNPPRELSSDFDVIYREATTSMAMRSRNLKRGSLTGSTVVYYVVSGDECFFINSPRTLSIARTIAREVETCASA